MKKILALVLSVMMLLSVMVPVAAEAPEKNVTLTVESVEGNPGGTVEVTVAVSNNPGMAGMVMTPVYDTEALTLDTAACVNGNVFTANPTVASNIVWAGSEDSFVNGDLITLVFTVNDAAELDAVYDISVIAQECNDLVGANISATVNAGSVTVVTPKANMTVATVEGTQGGTVEVTVEISNNIGMAGMVATPVYDAEALTLNTAACINGTVFTAEPTVASNIVWAGSEDSFVNGTLITLVFTVNQAAEANTSYAVDMIVRECNNLNGDNVAVNVTAGSVFVKVVSSDIVKANMTLGEDLTVNYYAEIDPAHAGAQMRFTRNGKVTVVDGVATETPNLYKYSYSNIAPQCMGDNIKAELILGEAVLDVQEEYSVKTYCMNTLAKSAETLNMSEEKYSALRTLIADILTYGAKAQLYRGYKVGSLVNEGVEGATEFVELGASDKYIDVSKREEDGIKITASGVYFDYTNSLYVKFCAPGLGEGDISFEVLNDATGEKVEYGLSQCRLINEETSEYMLILDPVCPTEYNDLYCIDMNVADARGRFRLAQSLEYNLASYVYSMQNRVDDDGNLTPMAELARATYNYGLSASAFAAIGQ